MFRAKYPSGRNKIWTEQAIGECEAFMERLYAIIVDKWLGYIKSSEDVRKESGNIGGWFQNDLYDKNFLWAPDLESVNVIDWDQAEIVTRNWNNKNIRKRWKEEQFHKLATESSISLNDYKSNGIEYPGICRTRSTQSKLK
ncbi:hypothetical protein FRB95_008215 [Tulasnella sp. JGI-2019a]|nr:hypothetical protein FRB95_008215 [Tulasnella sp. JGI-2019a]